jgi:hypothetical protein
MTDNETQDTNANLYDNGDDGAPYLDPVEISLDEMIEECQTDHKVHRFGPCTNGLVWIGNKHVCPDCNMEMCVQGGADGCKEDGCRSPGCECRSTGY